MAAHLGLFLLPLFLSAAIPTTSAAAGPNATLISDTCRHTTVHYNFCVSALSSDPKTKTARDVPGLLAVAIELAANAAVNTSTYVEGLLDKTNDTSDAPAFQQCLSDCSDQYVDVSAQLDDAAASLQSKVYKDVIRWVEAAMADVKTCQAGCKEVPAHKNVLTKRNGDFDRLGSIILAITAILSP